mgnify:CR=1 FL=1
MPAITQSEKVALIREDLWRKQDKTCPLCLEYIGFEDAVLDHCHKTKKFRGWLCDFCNRGIGLLGDNKEGVKMATKYLEGTDGHS